ncbi:glycoside hydrolase 5 family protein [Spirosoma luteolum]
MKRAYCLLAGLLALGTCTSGALAQSARPSMKTDGIFVDKQGIMRWQKSRQEAAFFGVNYTAPFAFAYRAHNTFGLNAEAAIRQDVYQIARLGLDAFRVHVWDTEISDSTGNLLANEQLRLFDFLVAELTKRGIKTIVTPIAFWGNGYPEPDEATPGFSHRYGKARATVEEGAIRAQERYLGQFFRHKNPYTGLTYSDDPAIIATEINNEPTHSGPKTGVTAYINRLAAAIRASGWRKPVFYNISQNPTYADAVANAAVDGVSFQWYPTGLVAGRALRGNLLPNVDRYTIPFDTIPAFRNKARMIYEFDAGDVLQPVMYPAMARSFRTAGFQWATQFAYDPTATAYANPDYQTHYLNLLYTPAKAISLLIAGQVFHTQPRLKDYGAYPASATFAGVRLNPADSLSELNRPDRFYYTNTTTAQPVQPAGLRHLAGVGSSPVARYTGLGAYFLDKLADGIWRLEVLPDAVTLRDPFARPSLGREVTRLVWRDQTLRLGLADLGDAFSLTGMNAGNTARRTASGGQVVLQPGTYLLVRAGLSADGWTATSPTELGPLGDFAAPAPVAGPVLVRHDVPASVPADQSWPLEATVVGLDRTAQVSLRINQLGGSYATLPMRPVDTYTYRADVPADLVKAGQLQYRVVVQQADSVRVFPGNKAGNPDAWDYQPDAPWQVAVTPSGAPLRLYDATTDRAVVLFPDDWQGRQNRYVAGQEPARLAIQLTMPRPTPDSLLGLQLFVGDKIQAVGPSVSGYQRLRIRGRAGEPVRVALINQTGDCYALTLTLPADGTPAEVPLSRLRPDAGLLLPRPYPDFMPLRFRPATATPLAVGAVEKLEVTAPARPGSTLTLETVDLLP